MNENHCDNERKRAELPNSYFQRLKEVAIDISKHLLLPEYSDEPQRLETTTESYLTFRNARAQRIWEIASKIINPEHKP